MNEIYDLEEKIDDTVELIKQNLFLDEVKNNESLNKDFLLFINKTLDLHNGRTTNLSFPLLNRRDAQSEHIDIVWN